MSAERAEKTERKGLLKNEPLILFYPALAKAFGICGALLIQQIHYWTITKPKKRDGYNFCYNTYQAWAEQLGPFSERTVRAAVKKLERQGVLVVDQFNRLSCDRTRWYRVDYNALCAALGVLLGGEWQILPPRTGKNCHIQVARIAAPIPEINSEINAETSSCELKLAQTSEEKITGKEEQEGTVPDVVKKQPSSTIGKFAKNEKVEKNMELNEILNTHKETPKGNGIASYWQSRMATIFGGYQKQLTQKERGQLNMLAKQLGERTREVIDFALNNWWKFAHRAKSHAGLDVCPAQPNIGFLLKYHGTAMELLTLIAAGTEVQEPQVDGPVVSAPAAQKQQAEKPATLEECLAIEEEHGK